MRFFSLLIAPVFLSSALIITSCHKRPEEPKTKASPRFELGMNDVSVLFPVRLAKERTQADEDSLLTFSSKGKQGELISQEQLQYIGYADKKRFRVVGFRLDPCFPDPGMLDQNPQLCLQQVRISLQNLDQNGFDEAEPLETMHLLYKLKREDFERMLQDVAAQGDRTPEGVALPLGPHPVMAREGLGGPAATAIKRILLDYVGSNNLVGIAVMRELKKSQVWRFEAHERQPDGGFAERKDRTIEITRINKAGSKDIKGASSHPVSAELNLISKAWDLGAAKSPEIEAIVVKTLQIDNPVLTKIDVTRCVLCHVSDIARDHIAGGIDGRTLFDEAPERFSAAYPLTTTRKPFTFPQVNFGIESISQRTVNETAYVLKALYDHGFVK